jgi:hypothetical protein
MLLCRQRQSLPLYLCGMEKFNPGVQFFIEIAQPNQAYFCFGFVVVTNFDN